MYPTGQPQYSGALKQLKDLGQDHLAWSAKQFACKDHPPFSVIGARPFSQVSLKLEYSEPGNEDTQGLHPAGDTQELRPANLPWAHSLQMNAEWVEICTQMHQSTLQHCLQGGEWASVADFYHEVFGVTSMRESADRIAGCIRQQQQDQPLIVIGHNGPHGLGASPECPAGKDFIQDPATCGGSCLWC